MEGFFMIDVDLCAATAVGSPFRHHRNIRVQYGVREWVSDMMDLNVADGVNGLSSFEFLGKFPNGAV